MSLLTSLMRTTPEGSMGLGDTPKHLGWVMLTALGIGATIGAGIFAMPGIIAGKAGPAGILSFVITGFVIMIVAFCYEKFSIRVPNGCLRIQLCLSFAGRVNRLDCRFWPLPRI